MYAVIKTGGKQYRVSPGDKLRVESLAADEGASIDFDEILMVCNGDDVTVGNPCRSMALPPQPPPVHRLKNQPLNRLQNRMLKNQQRLKMKTMLPVIRPHRLPLQRLRQNFLMHLTAIQMI